MEDYGLISKSLLYPHEVCTSVIKYLKNLLKYYFFSKLAAILFFHFIDHFAKKIKTLKQMINFPMQKARSYDIYSWVRTSSNRTSRVYPSELGNLCRKGPRNSKKNTCTAPWPQTEKILKLKLQICILFLIA